jgi:hypothetical protein
MTVYPPVSVFLGDRGECQLELDGGERAEGSLASPAEAISKLNGLFGTGAAGLLLSSAAVIPERSAPPHR